MEDSQSIMDTTCETPLRFKRSLPCGTGNCYFAGREGSDFIGDNKYTKNNLDIWEGSHKDLRNQVNILNVCLRSLSNLGNVAPVAAISGSTVSRNIVHGFSLSLSSIICEVKERHQIGVGRGRGHTVKKCFLQYIFVMAASGCLKV